MSREAVGGRKCGEHCQAPLSTRPAGVRFCSLGCALRARIPVDAQGNFPVNRWLVSLLIGFILFFNQLMVGGAIFWRQHQGKPAAPSWAAIELGLALLVWLNFFALHFAAKVTRLREIFFALLCGAGVIASLENWPRSGAILALGNGVFILWSLRGLGKTRA